jgi:putative oxidoreductase
MVLLGVWMDLGALLLVVFLLPTAVLMHGFWKETDAQAKMTETVQFSKDLGLAGASLMLFAFFSFVGDDLGLTITGPLFHLK